MQRLLLVILATLTLTGCRAGGQIPPVPADDVLIIAKPKDATGLDPACIGESESSAVTRSIFDTLVRQRDDSMELEPALATSWEHTPDGLQWIFHLRHGVKFHDGTPFDAQAVADNYSRQFQPQHPLHFPGLSFGYWADTWGTKPSLIKSVVAANKDTVRFELTQISAPFLENLAMPFFAIASPTALKQWGIDSRKHPVGTGPFKFVEWIPNERIVLEANPDYWDGAPRMKRLIFKPVADATSRQLQLESGAAHLITGILIDKVERLQRNPAVKVELEPGMNVGFLAMNNRMPPFDNRDVRLAVNYAIERKTLTKALYFGLAEVADSHMPPMIWGRPKLTPYDYDPQKARELLAQAGFPHGFKSELWYMGSPRPYYPNPKAMGEVLQAMLGEVGIEVELKAVDWGTYLEQVGKGLSPLALNGWIGDTGDPDNYLFVFFDSGNIDTERGGSNRCLYDNPEVHRLLVEAQKTIPQEKRSQLYQQAEQLIHADAPSVPLVYVDQISAHHPRLKGYRLHPTGGMILQHAYWDRT